MHPLILYNINDPEDAAKAEAAGMEILKLCVDAGGCLTGEHGVGIEKRDLMLTSSPRSISINRWPCAPR